MGAFDTGLGRHLRRRRLEEGIRLSDEARIQGSYQFPGEMFNGEQMIGMTIAGGNMKALAILLGLGTDVRESDILYHAQRTERNQ